MSGPSQPQAPAGPTAEQQQMAQMQAQLEAQQAALAAQQAAAPAAPAEAAADSFDAKLEQIHKLAQLKEAGILTEEEFSAKKAQILGL
jgi:hypothetical protein